MNIIFEDDIFLMIGDVKNLIEHRHYAIQIIVSKENIMINNDTYSTCVIIGSNVPHFINNKANCASLFINPFSKLGMYLSSTICNKGISNFKSKVLEEFICNQSKHDISLLSILFKEEFYHLSNTCSKLDERVELVISFLKENVDKSITIEDITVLCHMSESRLMHLFKNETGTSIMRYNTWLRLMAASKFVFESRTHITNGAYKYGFSDHAHFSRTFKKSFGINFKKILNDS